MYSVVQPLDKKTNWTPRLIAVRETFQQHAFNLSVETMERKGELETKDAARSVLEPRHLRVCS